MLPNLPDVIYIPNFFDKLTASEYLAALVRDIEFASETYVFNDQVIETKRKISYHSEKSYSYSKQNYSGKSWNSILTEIKDKIEVATGEEFNGVLANHYENGEAGMGWHSDKEKELGSNPVIASVSFGQSRRFAFRHRKELAGLKNPPKLVEYTLNSGDLLIMKGDTQAYFEHCLIKDKSAKDLRINLTYRKIVT
jgi:alkylated DNA repair dioxygenase AlkB